MIPIRVEVLLRRLRQYQIIPDNCDHVVIEIDGPAGTVKLNTSYVGDHRLGQLPEALENAKDPQAVKAAAKDRKPAKAK
ncbi:MAG: hypothetical protein IID41_00975 [Planctomycetes bacterium]|nr:hypothetical protein [Planctomycetota bacterium]